MNIQSLYPASSPPLLGFPEEDFLNTILILFLKFWNLGKLTEIEFNFRELIKVFRVVDCRHVDWKSCWTVPDHKREVVIVADGDVNGLPDVLPVDCVEPGQLFHLVHTRDPEGGCF